MLGVKLHLFFHIVYSKVQKKWKFDKHLFIKIPEALGTEISLDLDALDLEARQTKTSRIKSKLSNWAERQAERSSTRSR